MSMTQCERILQHLKDFGSITPMEAFSEYGIQRLAARISDLRSRGVAIVATQETGRNRYGEKVHYSVYRLAVRE